MLPAVVTVRVQPPAIWPESGAKLSKTYSDQVPLAFVPLNADKVVAYGGVGAGDAMNPLAKVTNGNLSVRYSGVSGIGNCARERRCVLSEEAWRN